MPSRRYTISPGKTRVVLMVPAGSKNLENPVENLGRKTWGGKPGEENLGTEHLNLLIKLY